MTNKEVIKCGLICGMTAYAVDLSIRVIVRLIDKSNEKHILDKFKTDTAYRESIRNNQPYLYFKLSRKCDL